MYRNLLIGVLICYVKCLKSGSNPDSDNIHPQIEKHFGNNTRLAFMDIFNLRWNTTSSAGKKHKKSNKNSNFGKKRHPTDSLKSRRTIAWRSVLWKLMEILIVSWLVWFLENDKQLLCYQSGYRRSHLSIQLASFLTQAIMDSSDCHGSVLAAFIEFKSVCNNV